MPSPLDRMKIPTPAPAPKGPQEPQKAQAAPEAEVKDPDLDKKSPPEDPIDDEMFTDVDMETLFLTGTTKYTFKVGGKIDVTVRLMESDEVLQANTALYENPDKPISVAMLEHAIQVLSFVVLKYGEKDMSKLTRELRVEYFKKMPGVLVSTIAQKFSIFERSVTRMLSDEGFVKN